MQILVAEDNPENQEIIRRRLERAGYGVSIANNGSEAVAMAQSEKPDLVLMDISMPILSGIEATQQIRKIADICALPIIALTAHAMDGDEEKCVNAGCDAFATKPIRFKELIQLIERTVDQKTSARVKVGGAS